MGPGRSTAVRGSDTNLAEPCVSQAGGKTDANGKPMHDDFMKVLRAKGAGWVDYVFPKPGESKPSRKWTYVKGVSFDGTPGLIGAGFYPE